MAQVKGPPALAEPGFDFQHPHGGPPPSVTPVPGTQCPLLIFMGPVHNAQMHPWANTRTHKK